MTPRDIFVVAFAVAAVIAFVPFGLSENRMGDRVPPEWRAGDVFQNADVVTVVTGGELIKGGRVTSDADIFSRKGTIRILRHTVSELFIGDINEGEEIIVVQPPTHMRGLAYIFRGESLLFLRRMNPSDVELLQKKIPPWGEHLPETIYTLAEEEYQWMSWIQLKTIRPDGEIDEEPRSILAAQLTQFADVERERQAILTYIEELVALRQAVLADAELPDEEDLDRFQKAVMQSAMQELHESDE